ncbi:MAG: TIR domain-containing protein [Hyphomonadaceae bacterium]
MPDIFISYNREDLARAKIFAEAFEQQGFSVWWDVGLRSGEAYDEVTENALRAAKAVVVLWSKKSVASRWVRSEATLADRNRTLVPCMIEACERPIMFELTQTAELSHWTGNSSDPAWQAFLTDVRRFLGASAPVAPRIFSPSPAVAGRADAAPSRPAILILPFINLSGEAEQEFFSDGVTEDIITDLGRVSAISVVSRNAAFALKGKTIAAANLARDMKVTHILEGSIRKSGQRVRITATLVEAASDGQIWAERFDRTLDDIFAIQDEISQAIVGALKVKLAPAEKIAIEHRDTTNSEAYELFLMARQFSRSGSQRVKPLIERICKRVIELDPTFARAWAQIAFAQSEEKQRGVFAADHDGGLAAAEMAMKLDPDLAESQAAMAEVIGRGQIMDMDRAKPFAEAALRLDPDCYEANLFFGYIHLGCSEHEEAIRSYEKAIALYPQAVRPCGMVVQAYQAIGDTQNGLAAARRCLAVCEKVLAAEPDHSEALGFLVSSLSDLDEPDRARDWARRAMLFDPDNMRMHYNIACAMAGLKDVDAACDILDRVVPVVNAGWLAWMEKDTSLDPIRDAPRFNALMQQAKARWAAREG